MNRICMRIKLNINGTSIFRPFAQALLGMVLLTVATVATPQTIEWWDRSGEAGVVATPYGIYSVSQADGKGMLSKHEADGSLTWRLLAEVGDLATIYHSVAADENGVYVVGTAIISDPRPDPPTSSWQTAFVQKYTHDGVEVWRYVDWFDGPPGHRIRNSTGCSIVVDDSGIYTTTGQLLRKRCGGFLRKLSFDGDLVWLGGYAMALAVGDGKLFTESRTYSNDGEFLGDREKPNPRLNVPERGLSYYDGALYFCSLDRLSGDPAGPAQVDIYKTDLNGNVAWHVAYPRSVYHAGPRTDQSCVMTADSNGVYLAANLAFRPYGKLYRPGLTVRQWNFSGQQTATWDFPSLGDPRPFAISVLGGAVYVSGHDPEANTGFTAQVSGNALLAPQAVSFGHSGRLAVLDHTYGYGPVTLHVRNIDGTGDQQRLAFSNGLRPIDVFQAGYLNGTGAEELGLLSREPEVVEIIDSRSGEQVLSINLDTNFEPIAAVAVAAGSVPIVAVLIKHRERTYLRIEEFDARSGTSLRTIPFNPAFEPLDLLDLTTGEDRRYAVLQANPEPGKAGKLEIRDINGTTTTNVWLGKNMVPQRALVYTDGAKRIAVLRRNDELGWQDIAIVDPEAGVIVQTLAFNPQYATSDFVHSPDIDANMAAQFSAAGRRDSDGKVKVETRDLASGYVLHNVFLTPGQPIQDVVYLGKESGATMPSLGLLTRTRTGFGIVIVDLLTGEKTGELEYQF